MLHGEHAKDVADALRTLDDATYAEVVAETMKDRRPLPLGVPGGAAGYETLCPTVPIRREPSPELRAAMDKACKAEDVPRELIERWKAETGMEPLILQSRKQPFFDTLLVPESGLLNATLTHMFVDCKRFPDGRPKTFGIDCNYTCDSMLGTPVEYDLSALELRFEKFSHGEDVRRVLKGIGLRWMTGHNTPLLALSGSAFHPWIDCSGVVDADSRKRIEAQFREYSERGVWTVYRHPVQIAGKPKHISSTEMFRLDVELNVGELYGPLRLKVLMQDTLFAPESR